MTEISSPKTVSPEVRAMIERLIAHDTTSTRSNLDLIHDVRDYLAGLGVESHLVHNNTGEKANLYATLGPLDRGGIALSGHSDVVPVEGQDWSSDPWRVEERDGRLYGRGACDMKGFIAVALAYVPKFLAADLATPVHICLSYDEELGCLGVPHLLAELARRPIRPRAAIIGEPTNMKVVVGHKGKHSYVCRVRGRECHSSLAPQGVNAVIWAARVITRLAEMAAQKAEKGPFDEDYDIPYSTVHVGPVEGGTALNIVPNHCRFEFEFRCLAEDRGEDLYAEIRAYADAELAPRMRAIAPESGFDWDEVSMFPGLSLDPKAEIVNLAKALTGANATGKVAFGTEAGLFQENGIPAVICGPGSIDQAHKPDEFVSLEQIALCESFMGRLLDRLKRA